MRIPWNKGLKGVMPTPWNKGLKTGLVPKTAFKKGFTPWNVGKRYKLGENPKRKGKHYSLATEFKKGVYYPYSHHFEKGHIPWFKEKGLDHPLKGKKFSKEWRAKISAGNKGKKFSSEHLKNLSLSHKGKKLSEEQKKKIGESLKKAYLTGKKKIVPSLIHNKPHDDEAKKRMSAGHQHIKLEDWKEYITPINIVERMKFKYEIQKEVLKRDNYTCQMCGSKRNLQVDHIQSWSKYVELRFCIDNCRTLCRSCHYEVTYGRPMPLTAKKWGHAFSERNVKYG